MKHIVSNEDSLKKELDRFGRDEIISLMARLKKMDLLPELGDRMDLINQALSLF